MKRNAFILLAIGLLGLAGVCRAVVTDDFSTANAHYEVGRFNEALNIYLPLSRQVTNWKVFYNIGNCYFKLGRPLAAKISYLRARKLRPLDPSIARNILIVNKRFADAIQSEPPDFVSRVLQILHAKLSLNALSLLL
ncbi:MAG TPA: hypothetical protein VLQ89_07300, partial [Candidatus Binatia bacterium]|nr:hypothetical protein [Candidatus Binatia bacterium]